MSVEAALRGAPTSSGGPPRRAEPGPVGIWQEDRGNQWQHYQLIQSLQEYALISQSQRRVERYRRLPTGDWEYHDATDGAVPLLTGASLELGQLYADLPEGWCRAPEVVAQRFGGPIRCESETAAAVRRSVGSAHLRVEEHSCTLATWPAAPIGTDYAPMCSAGFRVVRSAP